MNLPIVLNTVSDIRSGEIICSKGSLRLFLGSHTFEEINTKNILGSVSEDNPLRDTVIWHLFFSHSTRWVFHILPFMLECATQKLEAEDHYCNLSTWICNFSALNFGGREKLGTMEKACTVPKCTWDY